MSTFPGVDDLLVETAERAFAGTSTHEAVTEAEASWPQAIWDTAAEIGLPWISVPESASGSGGTLLDALAVVFTAARFGAPIPLAETGLLAGWLAAGCGVEVSGGPETVAAPNRTSLTRSADGTLTGTLQRVPWGRDVQRIWALVDDRVVAVDPAACTIENHASLAGEPRDTVQLAGVTPVVDVAAPAGIDAAALELRGMLVRAVQMGGALSAMSRLTVEYTGERKQFGKPIGTFQAVQQHVVHTAQDAALVTMAAVTAGVAYDASADASFEICSAKLLANQAATHATAASHQAHGAMGMTKEYSLGILSRRLWAWQSEFGSEAALARRVGEMVASAGADGLYPLIARRPA